jgi:Transposase DDE domain
MALADSSGLPFAVSVTSASPREVTLVDQALVSTFVDKKPKRLIADRAYDSDPLDVELECQGIEMIAPHRRRRRKTEDPGRAQAAALQEALEGGAPVRLARELQTSGRPLRA